MTILLQLRNTPISFRANTDDKYARVRSERVGIAKTKELEFGHTAGKAYIQSLKEKGEDLGRYGITMTKLPKVGINPGSRYNTPIGVYFYPARYYLKRSELPFEHDANYINVIKFKDGAKILDLGVIEEEDLDTLVSKLSKIYPPEKVQQYYKCLPMRFVGLILMASIQNCLLATHKLAKSKLWH